MTTIKIYGFVRDVVGVPRHHRHAHLVCLHSCVHLPLCSLWGTFLPQYMLVYTGQSPIKLLYKDTFGFILHHGNNNRCSLDHSRWADVRHLFELYKTFKVFHRCFCGANRCDGCRVPSSLAVNTGISTFALFTQTLFEVWNSVVLYPITYFVANCGVCEKSTAVEKLKG